MRRVVVVDDLREFEIRPQENFEHYVRLVEQAAESLLAERDRFEELAVCPACGESALEPAFSKLGFQYVRCRDCRSLYVSPRPTEEMLKAFYTSSQAISFWNENVAAATSDARSKYVFLPRAQWLMDMVQENGQRLDVILDFNSKYPEFLRAVRKYTPFDSRLSFRPMEHVIDTCRLNEFIVVGEIPRREAGVVTAMEVLERVHDPWQVVAIFGEVLIEGGLLFLTTMSSSGFDIQVLGEHAPNLIPPTHLNLLSVEGVTTLFERRGFDVVELSTPGRLDIEMVVSVAKRYPDLSLPPWIDDLVRRRGERVHRAFQEFLQTARLSSHLRLVARKKEDGESS